MPVEFDRIPSIAKVWPPLVTGVYAMLSTLLALCRLAPLDGEVSEPEGPADVVAAAALDEVVEEALDDVVATAEEELL